MRIVNSSVSMSSARTYQAEAEITQTHLDRGQGSFKGSTRLTVSTLHTKQLEVQGGMTHYVSANQDASAEQAPIARQTVSAEPGGSMTKGKLPQTAVGTQDWLSGIQSTIDNDPKVQILRKMVELLERITGKKFSRGILDKPFSRPGQSVTGFAAASASYRRTAAMAGRLQLTLSPASGSADAPIDISQATPVNLQPVNGYWMRQTIQSGFVKGEEHTSYASVGTAVTADGRTIDFGVSMEMSRSFESAFTVIGKEEVFTDPLVINLDTDAASLSDVSFYFDLDCDGKEEELSSLGEGSGFLALDKNGDGKINDGSELFGAKTGNGFGELAQYDQDGNGWIDEGDEVFSRLSVWTRCGDGEQKLVSLKDAGVGAIFLGSQATQFTLADPQGNENAQVRRTGMYLKESGQVGTVQHVDFKA